jgi:hypothetical protein
LKDLVLNSTVTVPRHEQYGIVTISRAITNAQPVCEAAILLILIRYRMISAALRVLFNAEQLTAAKQAGANHLYTSQRQLISVASDQMRKLFLKVVIAFILVVCSTFVRVHPFLVPQHVCLRAGRTRLRQPVLLLLVRRLQKK